MKIRSRYALAGLVAGSAALVGGLALPATAAPGDTVTTFTIAGGGLTVTPADNADLGDTVAAGTTDVAGQLGAVTVTDDRDGTAGWTVSAASTEFHGALAGNTGAISTEVDYTAGDLDNSGSTGTSTVGSPTGAVQIDGGAATVASAVGVSGDNVATWNPTLDVTMPAGALADTYTGTVTTSVS